MDRLILLVAQGFGTGLSPVAPGTFGTLAGLPWIYLLLIPRSLAAYIVGTLAGLGFALWSGSRAERFLKQKDPGSIVIDEIAALPLAFLPVAVAHAGQPAGSYFSDRWIEVILAFIFFRVFDVWKPLGIRAVQDAPGGLVLDDLLAALLAALVLWGYMSL